MKILLSVISLFLFVSIGFCQSVTISPTSTQSLLHIKKGASGVGAFNTNANLHVESNLNNYISMLTPNAFESGILFGNPTSTADGGIIYNAGNAKGLQFRTNTNITRMTIDALGNLGIGATNPSSKLDIQGSLYRNHFFYDTSEDTYIRGGKNSSRVIINDIIGLGNVGIGTNNPQAKLHISQGNLRLDNLAGSGNVQMYADDNGTVSGALPVAFSVNNPNNLAANIASGVETTFPFTTEEYDLGGFYNNTTYEFSAPLNAIYHFDAFVTFGAVSSTTSFALYSIYFYVDNGLTSVIEEPIFVGSFNTLNFSQDVKLNAGQKVKIRVIQTSGSSLQLLGGISSKFTGHLVTRL